MKQYLLPFLAIFAFVLLGNLSLQAQKLLEKPVIDNVVVVFNWENYTSSIAELANNSVSTSDVEENICGEEGSNEQEMPEAQNNNGGTHTHTEENATSQNENNSNETEVSTNDTTISNEATDNDTDIILQTTDPIELVSIQVYPNPASDWVNITVSEFSASQIRLVNLSGQIVAQWNKGIGEQMVISVADIPAGLYLLHIYQEGKNIVHKLEVHH